MLRIGIVDCDTSHVYQFARRLNHIDIESDQWVDGANIVAAWEGSSQVTDPERIAEYLVHAKAAGVVMVDRPEDLLGQVDAIFIESNQGGVHRERATPFIKAGLPVFIDKPLEATTTNARELVNLAARRGVPLISASAARFDPEIQAIRRGSDELGQLVGADVYGTAVLHPLNPGLLHYGVHAVEMLYTLLGTGCQEVTCTFHDDGEVVTGRWNDGKIGTVRGLRRGTRGFGFTAYGERAIRHHEVTLQYGYRDMLAAVVPVLAGGTSLIGPEELIEVVAFQEAAYASRLNGGKVTPLAR